MNGVVFRFWAFQVVTHQIRRWCRRLWLATTVFFNGTWSEVGIWTCRARSALKWRERNEFMKWVISLTSRFKYIGPFLYMEAKWPSFMKPRAWLTDSQSGDPIWTPHCYLLCSTNPSPQFVYQSQICRFDGQGALLESTKLTEGLWDPYRRRWASVMGLEFLTPCTSFFLPGAPMGPFF